MNMNLKQWFTALVGSAVILIAGCVSTKTPATADVAVSAAAVENAARADAGQYAPVEMNLAREKLAAANKAMGNRDYKRAAELATEAEVDAKLAQSKAASAKTQAVADAMQQDIRILREELSRANKR